MSNEVVVFSSLNVAEVHLVHGMLSRAGIPSRLKRAFLGPLAGEIPMDDARAELVVPEAHVADALSRIASAREAAATEHMCPACGEVNPGSFELCWSCGADLPAP